MNREEKINELFKELINKMYEPFNLTYEELKNIPDFYSQYEWNKEQEDEYKEWAIDLIKKRLKISKKAAVNEASLIILAYSPKTKN